MAFTPTKPSVFNTGPDTALKAVDIYGEGEVAQEAIPENPTVTDYLTGKLSLGNVATIEAERILSISDRLSLGLDDSTARRLLDVTLPDDFDTLGFLNDLPDVSIGSVSEMLGQVSDKIGITDFLNLDTNQITTYVKNGLEVLTSTVLCNDGGLDGLFDFSMDLSDWMLSLEDFDFCDPNFGIDLSGVASELLPYASNKLLDMSADLGLLDVSVDLVNSYGNAMSDAVRSTAAKSLLANYVKPPLETLSNYAALGTDLINGLDTIDPHWLSTVRDGAEAINLSSTFDVSVDALSVLSDNVKVQTAKLMRDSYDTKSEPAYADKERFPYLYEPIARGVI